MCRWVGGWVGLIHDMCEGVYLYVSVSENVSL